MAAPKLFPMPAESMPSLAGVTFGIDYDDCVALIDWNTCATGEIPSGHWPAPGSGTTVAWGVAQTGRIVDVYWFAGYSYDGNPAFLDLVPHPDYGATFNDGASNSDPVAALGTFGFFAPGRSVCPDSAQIGACCTADARCVVTWQQACFLGAGLYQGNGTTCDPDPCAIGACCFADGSCQVMGEEECEGANGGFQGLDVGCDPNPCSPTPVISRTWGQIKAQFRAH